jgi:hypothetical protein
MAPPPAPVVNNAAFMTPNNPTNSEAKDPGKDYKNIGGARRRRRHRTVKRRRAAKRSMKRK